MRKPTNSKVIKLTVGGLADKLVADTPDGWQVERVFGRTFYCDGDVSERDEAGTAYVRWQRDTTTQPPMKVVVAANISVVRGGASSFERERAFHGCAMDGNTLLNGGSFIRRGIDVSCWDLRHAPEHDNEYATVPDALAGQLARCEAVAARRLTAVKVPGLPYTRQPDWFTKAAADLQAGKPVYLHPHGMGTGHILRTGTPRRSRFGGARRADAALEQKLGVAPLTVEAFDAD